MTYREVTALMANHVRRSPGCSPATASVHVGTAFGVGGNPGRCLRCGVALDETEAVRVELMDLGAQRTAGRTQEAEAKKALRPLVVRGRALGITPTELARETGLSRHTVYEWLGEEPEPEERAG